MTCTNIAENIKYTIRNDMHQYNSNIQKYATNEGNINQNKLTNYIYNYINVYYNYHLIDYLIIFLINFNV